MLYIFSWNVCSVSCRVAAGCESIFEFKDGERKERTLTHIHHLCYLYLKHVGFNVYYCDQSKGFVQFLLSLFFFFYFVVEKKLSKRKWHFRLVGKTAALEATVTQCCLSHTVLLSFALSAAAVCVCVCMCVSPVGLPVFQFLSVLWRRSLKSFSFSSSSSLVFCLVLSVLLTSAHTDCLLQLCVDSVTSGVNVPVKLMSTRRRSSPLLTGVLSPVQPEHSEESSLSPHDEIRSTSTLKSSSSPSAETGTEEEMKPF